MRLNLVINKHIEAEKLLQFLHNKKKHTLLIDSQFLLENFPMKCKNISHEYKISIYNLLFVSMDLRNRVKYFSFADVLKNNYFNIKCPDSIAYKINTYCSPETILFNGYIGNKAGDNLYIKTLERESCAMSSINSNTYFLNINEMVSFLSNKYFSLYFSIICSKILSSSFFLSEVLSICSIESSYALLHNKFFNNLEEFKSFCRGIDLKCFLLHLKEFSNFLDAFIYVNDCFFLNIPEEISENLILETENIYCADGCVFSLDNKNISKYFYQSSEIKYKTPEKRIMTLSGEGYELYSNAYDFYMHHILKFKRKSLHSLMLKNIYDVFLLNKELDGNLIKNNASIALFLDKLKPHIKIDNKNIIYKDKVLFFAFKQYEIDKIKKIARNKNLSCIYVANLNNFLMEEIELKAFRKKKLVVLKY
jgi:hypothetical protein